MWFFKLIESFFKRERGEQGSGLMTVLGVSLVVTIAAGTITSSIVMASNLTSEKLSQQQADAAAEAGIADAIQKITLKECVRYFKSSSENEAKYHFKIARSTKDEMPTKFEIGNGIYPVDDQTKDENGKIPCSEKADRWILVESTGIGKNNTSKVKTAVFKVNPANESIIPQAITANKVDLRTNFKLNNNPSISRSNASIYTSNFVCNIGTNTTKSVVNANLNYESSLDLSPVGNCVINGNIESSISSESSIVDLKGMEINGNICSNKGFQNIEGLKGTKRTSINIPCNYEGTRYGYVPDMDNSVEVNLASCTDWELLKKQIIEVSGQNNGKNNVLDLSVCGSGGDNTKLRKIMYDDATVPGSRDFILKGDINLVFSGAFLLRNSTISSLAKNSTINFIVPSKTADPNNSSVPSGTGTSFFNNVKYSNGISGIVYTPSNFTTYTGTDINGQIYAGGTYTSSSTTVLNYTPVGLPNAEKKIKDIGRAPDLIRVY